MRKLKMALAIICVFGAVTACLGQAAFGPSAKDVKELKTAEAEYGAAKKIYERKPNAARKKAFLGATDRFAMTSMMSPALDPKVKYRQALRLYREALKLDPSNHEAKHNSDLIVSIYKSMHRPVPN